MTGIHLFDNGVRLDRRHISDVQAARYRVTNLHEPIEEAWFQALSLTGGGDFRFADIGAGIGYYAILLKLLRPTARVFCYEPLREHAEHLAANLALNDIAADCVAIFDLAVCDRSGRAAFHEENFGSRLLPDNTPTSSIVETTTLEAIVERTSGPLDLVKVDVQGDELRVIAGAGRVMTQIGAWIVGTHSHDLHQACLDELRRLSLTVLCEDEAPPHQPDGLIVAVAPGHALGGDRVGSTRPSWLP